MERVVYDRMAELDEVHWWYRARRDVLAALIRHRIPLPQSPRILEIGCGTGHNLQMFAQFGHVDALEVDPEARALAEQRLGRPVAYAPLPGLDGVAEQSFDLIAALDVIEHIEDDAAALESIAQRLRPGGRFLMTVPAHQWMWSAHDVVNHHVRRYSKLQLSELVRGSSMKLEALGYFNSLLFPLIASARIAGKLMGRSDSDDRLPPAPMNLALRHVFSLERHLIGRLPLTTGVSLFAIASAT